MISNAAWRVSSSRVLHVCLAVHTNGKADWGATGPHQTCCVKEGNWLTIASFYSALLSCLWIPFLISCLSLLLLYSNVLACLPTSYGKGVISHVQNVPLFLQLYLAIAVFFFNVIFQIQTNSEFKQSLKQEFLKSGFNLKHRGLT